MIRKINSDPFSVGKIVEYVPSKQFGAYTTASPFWVKIVRVIGTDEFKGYKVTREGISLQTVPCSGWYKPFFKALD